MRLHPLCVGALVGLATLVSACTSNPVDDHDDHPEAFGLSLSLAGTEIYRVVNAVATCPAGPCADAFTFAPGADVGPLNVTFLDASGAAIAPEALEEGVSLGVVVEDPGVVDVAPRDPEAPWLLRLTMGDQPGESGLRLQLLHNGHPDFSTPPFGDPNGILVRVTP